MLSFLLGLLRIKWLPWAFVVAMGALAAVSALSYSKGYNRGQSAIQSEFDAYRADAAARALAMASEYRTREQEMQRNVDQISAELNTSIDQTRTEYIVALDSIRGNSVRLREQFRSCSANMPSPSHDSSAPRGNDDSSQDRFSETIVRPVLRAGNEADIEVAKLVACQQYVSRIQSQINQGVNP